MTRPPRTYLDRVNLPQTGKKLTGPPRAKEVNSFGADEETRSRPPWVVGSSV